MFIKGEKPHTLLEQNCVYFKASLDDSSESTHRPGKRITMVPVYSGVGTPDPVVQDPQKKLYVRWLSLTQ